MTAPSALRTSLAAISRKNRLGVGAGQSELGEGGLIEQRRRLPRRAMFPRHGVKPVWPLIGVVIVGGFSVFREPVGALPTELFAEYSARRLEPIVERRTAQRPPGTIFLGRPRHRVVFGVGFERARTDPVGIAMAASEPPDVSRPEIERRRAFHDPFGERHSRAAPGCDAEGVETRADKDVAHLGRLAKDEIAVRREALRPVDHLLDADVAQGGHAPESLLHDRLEMVPIRLQKLKLEILRQWVGQPGPGIGLVAAHHQAADLFLPVGQPVRIAQRRQARRHAGHCLGDDVLMLDRGQRDVDAGEPADGARPLAGADD